MAGVVVPVGLACQRVRSRSLQVKVVERDLAVQLRVYVCCVGFQLVRELT
jgi:hypothetical protein